MCGKPISADLSLIYFRNGYSCSEAVLRAFNETYGLSLPDDCCNIASGFGCGFGGAGCACGAVSGCVMVLGLFCRRENIRSSGQATALAAKQLHDSFMAENGAVCCRLLIKSAASDSPGFGQAEEDVQETRCESYVLSAARITDGIIRSYMNYYAKG